MTGAQRGSDPRSVGPEYEAGLSDAQRKLGSHFTPFDVADMLVRSAFALSGVSGVSVPTVCDPSCGGGVFLLAAADRLAEAGLDPARIVVDMLVGCDTDTGAVAATTAALRQWAADRGVTDAVDPIVVQRDALSEPIPGEGTFSFVLGNPPFQNQLGSRTVRSAADRDRMRERFSLPALGYVDTAALFQLRSLELVGPGGVTVLIQPRSFLVARDVEPIRANLLRTAHLCQVWLPGEPVFAAGVDVCATFVRKPRAGDTFHGEVRVTGGRTGDVDHGMVRSEALAGSTWSAIWAQAKSVPVLERPAWNEISRGGSEPVIGDVSTVTAGFRDQYYGFLPHLRERRPVRAAPLITTAMIDPGICRWANRDVRIAGTRWSTPWLDREALERSDPKLDRWVEQQARPKVLVATQTNVIEAVIDRAGDWVPMTPIISVVPTASVPSSTGLLVAPLVGAAHLEAALLAPAATAWAMRQFGGGAMSSGGLKLAARQVAQIPLPRDREAWDAAVELLADRADGVDVTHDQWRRFGGLMNDAWECGDPPLLEWWLARLPRIGAHANAGATL